MGNETTGTLDRYPLPRLLCFLEKKEFTGVLRIEDTGITREVLVNEGIPCALYPKTLQALTRQFLEWGRLDTEQYAKLMTSLSAAGAQEEQLLVEVANITADELLKGRRYLLFKDLCRLFAIPAAPFVLSAQLDPRLQQHDQQVAIEPMYLVYNGIRNSYTEARIRADLGALDDHAIRLQADSDDLVARFGFGEEEASILQYLRHGYWILPDLITACQTEPLPVLMVVYALWSAGGLEMAKQDSVPRLQPKSPAAPHPAPSSPSATGEVGTEANLMADANPEGRTDVARVQLRRAAVTTPSAQTSSAAPAPTPTPTPTPTPAPAPAPTPTTQPRPAPSATPSSAGPKAGGRRKAKTMTPMSGTFAAAKIPDLVLRKARMSATRLKSEGNLKPEAIEILEELVDRLDAMEGQSPFEQLGVPLDTTSVDVKRAYMGLVKRLHPDRLASIGLEELTEAADALFKRFTQSHQTLSEPDNLDEARRIFSGETSAQDPEEARRAIEAEVNFQKGEVFFRKGDFSQAETYFRLSVEGNPQEGEHLALLAWTIYQSTPKGERDGRRADILKMIVRSLELSPNCAKAHYFLGKLYLEIGQQDSAMSSFRRATAIKRNYIEAMRELRLLTMRRERENAPKRRSTILEMFSLKKRKK
jgi:tetratricopeptide (TPR) repeat protein